MLSVSSVVQSCMTLQPHGLQHARLPRLWDSPGILQSGLPFPSPMHESEKWKWSRSVMSDSWPAHGLQPTRLLPSMGFSRQEYWSVLPLPSPCESITIFKFRDSLAVQWLRIHLVMQGTPVQSLVWEDPTCHMATEPVGHNLWARALEPASCNY